MKDPAFLFYSKDFISGTMIMSKEEIGQYILAMCFLHQHGGYLPKSKLESAVGTLKTAVVNKMSLSKEGYLFNKRVLLEMDKRNNYVKSRQENGMKGGRPPKESTNNHMVSKENDWYEMVSFFGNKCLSCGVVFPKGEFPTKDHIIPKCDGGGDDISNLQPLCRECNSSKCADHITDYRINFYKDIPQKYKTIWFLKTKPSNNLPVNVNANVIVKEKSKRTKELKAYSEYVRMEEKDYNKLVKKFGKFYTEHAITILDNYIPDGKKMKDHYRAILKWAMQSAKEKFPVAQHQDGGKEAGFNREGVKAIAGLLKGLK